MNWWYGGFGFFLICAGVATLWYSCHICGENFEEFMCGVCMVGCGICGFLLGYFNMTLTGGI